MYPAATLLSAPSVSAGIPNEDGTLIAYTEATYSFELHSASKELYVLDIASGDRSAVASDVADFQWLEGTRLLWLKTEGDGTTAFVVGDAVAREIPHVAGKVAGPVSSLKVARLSAGSWGVAVSGKADKDGSLFNPNAEKKPLSSARIYTSLYVRHWDQYVTKQKNAVFFSTLENTAASAGSGDAPTRYELAPLTNLIHAAGLKGVESPIPTFGGSDHFDISKDGVVLVSKDPELVDALHTKCKLYYVRLPIWDKSDEGELSAGVLDLSRLGLAGALTSPVLSQASGALAFLAMREDGYESDKNRIVVVPELFRSASAGGSASPTAIEVFASSDGRGAWDRSPGALAWDEDGEERRLLIKAEDAGTVRLFRLAVPDVAQAGSLATTKLEQVPQTASVSGFAAKAGKLFLTTTSFVSNGRHTVLDPSSSEEISFSPGIEKGTGESFGLSASQVESIWYDGANKQRVHAWVLKPSSFTEGQRYPLCVLVHGGPQGAWNNSWSTRWNAAVFAEQGYVVVALNVTGSTGYGQQFTDDIREQWGGLPYDDLVRGFEYVEQHMPYVDTDRAVALGASYGGFMMNWVQGHALGRRFKALVTHDGIFSTKFSLGAEELYFPNRDLGGSYWENRETWERWDPANHLAEWQTPHLIIHSELDYRLTMTEGLAAFNVLQSKGVESKLLMFPDENHWVVKPENSLVWHRTVLNWINRFAGLPPYDAGEEPYEI
ncbi:hypothetical protein KEM52_006014 [Ascosphaera acerosa]|nr:hypothetical protein KEM52_006014 [Ascosphaera acerosa]